MQSLFFYNVFMSVTRLAPARVCRGKGDTQNYGAISFGVLCRTLPPFWFNVPLTL